MILDLDRILNKIPIVTLYFGLSILTTTILISFKLLNPKIIILDWLIIYKNRHLWRIITNYFFIGSFSMNWLMSIAMFIQFSTNLENNNKFSNSKGSYLYFIFLQMVVISGLSLLFYWPTGYPILFESLHFSILYYWSKMEVMTPISIYFFRVKGYQIPILLFIFRLVTRGSLINDIIGLLSGHLYYYCRDLNDFNFSLIKTPQLFDKIAFKMEYFTNYIINEFNNNNTNQGSFRGRGMRLN